MKSGDLVKFVYGAIRENPDMIGIIVSDYAQESYSDDGIILKNVYWFAHQWVRPIEQQYLEVINESR